MLPVILPSVPPTPDPPRLTRLFEAGKGGYHTYRIPALAVTPNGTVLAFCEGRRTGPSDHGEIDLLLRRSRDGGRTWEPPQVIAGDGVNTFGNPCPIVDRKTREVVLLFCRNGGTDAEDRIRRGEAPPRSVWVTASRDDGLTWSAPRDISNKVRRPGWRWYATGPCHGIQLAAGRLLAPCDYATGPGPDTQHSHVIYSDDHGANWRIGGDLPARTDECTVVERADGSLYLNARNYRGGHRRVVAVSADRGVTWTFQGEDAALIEPVCQGSALRCPAGRTGERPRVLFSNPASTRRENLSVRLSNDEGRTWPISRTLWPGPAGYSDLTVLPGGAIGCLFEGGEKDYREALVFARLSREWLTGGTDRR